MREIRNAYNILVGKLERNRSFERCRCRKKHSLKLMLEKNNVCGLDKTDQEMVQWRVLLNMAMHLREKCNARNFLMSCATI
jgi:hypothetical protein